MVVKLVRIGNSKGIRIPKAILRQTGIETEVNLRVEGQQIIIEAPGHHPRAGWERKMKEALAEHGDDIDDWREWQGIRNEFDEEEWTW